MQKAYKLFRVSKSHRGQIFPLYVLADKPIPIGVWLDAKEGERLPNGKVKSRLGNLCFRPGWHCSDIPLATHIGIKDKSGKVAWMNPNHVWAEVEYDDTVDYSDEARANGTNEAGKVIPVRAYLKHIPYNGSYRFKTSPIMLGEWIITGRIKVIRVLTDSEVENILHEAGYEPMPRIGGNLSFGDFGIVKPA